MESAETEGETSATRKRRKQTKTSAPIQQLGASGMNMAVSLTPDDGALKLGAKSGREKDSTSLPKTSTLNQRLGALGMNMGVSLTPYDGALKLGAKSGREKDSTSLHFTEYHATRYQYYFGINATHLKDFSRILPLVDGIMDMPKVGGSSNIFDYPFCPDSFVFQWTNHFASYISYCFESGDAKGKQVKLTKEFINEVECGQIDPEQLWIGGPIIKELQQLDTFDNSPFKKAHLYRNRNELVEALKAVIKADLRVEESK